MKAVLIEVAPFLGEFTSEEIEDAQEQELGGGRKYTHTCVICFSKSEGISVGEGEVKIKAPRTEHSIKRSEKYQFALAHVQQNWKFDTAKGDKIGSDKVRAETYVALKDMKEFFQPMLKILELKAMDENAALEAVNRYKAWALANPLANDWEKGLKADQELEEAMNKWRAFHSKGEQQAAFCRAADYADEWFGDLNKKFRVYYVCRSGPKDTPCDTLILAKDWKKLHEDPMATKQRWYCEECYARYVTKFGVVCELMMGDGNLRYCVAEIPPQGIMDAKFMSVELVMGAVATPEELFAKIPSVTPLATIATIKQTAKAGHYKFVDKKLADMPSMEWNQLFNLLQLKPVSTVKGEQ